MFPNAHILHTHDTHFSQTRTFSHTLIYSWSLYLFSHHFLISILSVSYTGIAHFTLTHTILRVCAQAWGIPYPFLHFTSRISFSSFLYTPPTSRSDLTIWILALIWIFRYLDTSDIIWHPNHHLTHIEMTKPHDFGDISPFYAFMALLA